MALKHIIEDIASVLGLTITNDEEYAYVLDQVNQAAREIYNSADLPGSIREQIFQFDDSSTYQISFPHYIEKIRAIRFYNTFGGKIAIEDLRPRYHQQRWGTGGLLKWRIKKSDSPIKLDILNAAPLTFSLPSGKTEVVDIVITVIGKTAYASRISESVTIPANSSSVQTVNGFDEIESIIKTGFNTYDITVSDIDGRELAVIPNNELKPSYTIVSVRQDDFNPQYNNNYPLNTIEVLYKHRFSPFRNLMDEFPCPNCDKIIFWKFAEYYCAYKPGMEQRALAAYGKVKQLIDELTLDDLQGKQIQLEYSANPMLEAQKASYMGTRDYVPAAPNPIITYTP